MSIGRKAWRALFWSLLIFVFIFLVPAYSYFNNRYEELERSYISEIYLNNHYEEVLKKKEIRMVELEKRITELETQIPK